MPLPPYARWLHCRFAVLKIGGSRAAANPIVTNGSSPETGKLDRRSVGALSGLLTLALGAKRKEGLSGKTQAIDSIEELVLVAGVGFEPTTFRL